MIKFIEITTRISNVSQSRDGITFLSRSTRSLSNATTRRRYVQKYETNFVMHSSTIKFEIEKRGGSDLASLIDLEAVNSAVHVPFCPLRGLFSRVNGLRVLTYMMFIHTHSVVQRTLD